MAFLKTLIFIFVIITPFDSLSQTARPTRNSHPEKSLIHPEHYIENKNVVRFDAGGTNYSGAPNYQYACSFNELITRTKNCSTIPTNPARGTSVFTTGVSSSASNICIEGTGMGMCEYITEWGEWKYKQMGLVKSTMGVERLDWFKSTPTQGAAKSIGVTNSAPGDMMAYVIMSTDTAGARSRGDEGNMLVRGSFNDWGPTSKGWVPKAIPIQPLTDYNFPSFSPIINGNRQLHWNMIGSDRTIIFSNLNSISITVKEAGWNPKPRHPEGGATWKLETPLPKILISRKQPNGLLRTDYCLALDSNEYQSVYGKEKQYLQVAETPDEYTIITNFVRQGQNIGMPAQYINGYQSIDTAISHGHNTGNLIPCSVIKHIDFPDTSNPEIYNLIRFKLPNSLSWSQSIQEGTFKIEPMSEVDIPKFTEYKIPAEGIFSLQAFKVVINQKLGGGETNAYVAFASGYPDSRPATRGFYIGGGIPQARKQAGYPYSFEKGVELKDTKHPLVIHNPSTTTPKRPFAVIGARNATYTNHIQMNYTQPIDGFSEVVFNPPLGKDNYVMTIRVGNNEPNPKTCSRPGLERYYQLNNDTEWICNSNKEFTNNTPAKRKCSFFWCS